MARLKAAVEGRCHILAGAGLILAILAGTLVPLYTDEIGWRFQERAWIDGVDKAYNDTCGPNTLARPPWFMLPVRWFSATANQTFADPLFVRIEGVLCALGWIGLLWLLVARLGRSGPDRRGIQALVFSLLGLGTLPFLQVLSRPEQPLLIALTLMLVIALAPWRGTGPATAAWLKGAAILLLGVVAVSYHLKGVVYAPVALACLAVCATGPGTRIPRLVFAALLVAIMAAGAVYWFGRFECPQNPETAAVLARENLAAMLSGKGSLRDAIGPILLGTNPLNYAWLAGLHTDMSDWLPRGIFPTALAGAVLVALTLLWGGAVLLGAGRLVVFLARERMKALVVPQALLALAVLACVEVWGVSQVNRNAYEAAHVLPMLAIFVALALSLPLDGDARFRRAQDWLMRLAVPAALISEAALLGCAGGPLIAANGTPGSIPGQGLSVSLSGYDAIRRDVAAAMRQAGLAGDRPRRGLVVDDVTYLALQRDRLPFHRLGLFAVWNFGMTNPAQYLLERKSDGIVMSCANLPMEFEAAATRAGTICALAPAQLAPLAARRSRSGTTILAASHEAGPGSLPLAR